MIPHKSRKYRAILDLSFKLMLNGYALPSVNEATERCAPEEALDQIGQVLPRIIAAMAEAPLEDGDIVLMKTDIKDGFWRMVCAEGFEWNFAYVLPSLPGQPVEIVVPSALQMGWALSPPFFCAASETARDIAASYVSEPIGSIPPHPMEHLTMPDVEVTLPNLQNASGKSGAQFLQLLEVYVDDFIQLVQSSDPAVLLHSTVCSLCPPSRATTDKTLSP